MGSNEKNNNASGIELLDKTKSLIEQIDSVKNTLLDIKRFKIGCEEHLIEVKRYFLKKTYEAEESILDLESSVLSSENKLSFSSPKDKPYYTMMCTKDNTNLKEARSKLREIKSSGKNETVLASNLVKLINIRLSTMIRSSTEAVAPLYTKDDEAKQNKEWNNKIENKENKEPIVEKSEEEKRHHLAKVEFKPILVKQNLISKGVFHFDDFHSFALDDEMARKLTESFELPTFGLIMKGIGESLKTDKDRICIIKNTIDSYMEIKTTYQPKINSILKLYGWTFVSEKKSWEVHNFDLLDHNELKKMIEDLSKFFDILIDVKTASIRKKSNFKIQ